MAQTTEQGGMALRYAKALLELAEEKHALDAISADLVALGHMIADSSRPPETDHQPPDGPRRPGARDRRGGEGRRFGDLTRAFLGLIAANRRLFALPAIIKAFQKMLADNARRGGGGSDRGPSPVPMRRRRRSAMPSARRGRQSLDRYEGRSRACSAGSSSASARRMIDASLQTKLQRLQLAMKGAAMMEIRAAEISAILKQQIAEFRHRGRRRRGRPGAVGRRRHRPRLRPRQRAGRRDGRVPERHHAAWRSTSRPTMSAS